MPYDVEICERVPVVKVVKVPVHVPVSVPVKVPVYCKEYVPNYVPKIIPVERKVYKTINKVVDVCKPVVCTSYKKQYIEVPVYKKEIIPIIKTTFVKKPVPIFETQFMGYSETSCEATPQCDQQPPAGPCNCDPCA